MNSIKILYALGNPRLSGTYHNIGMDLFESLGFTWQKEKFFAFHQTSHLILAKNLIWMNLSGLGVKEALIKFKIKPANLCLIHDDNDLLFGWVKLQFKKGSAGHKGVESVIKELGTKDFWRLRVGIAHLPRKKAENFVLKKLTTKDKKIFRQMVVNFPQLIKILASTDPWKINLPRDFLIKN